jgi:hypothetical protein
VRARGRDDSPAADRGADTMIRWRRSLVIAAVSFLVGLVLGKLGWLP